MTRVFKGWRRLRPKDILRRTDRWTFVPENYTSPGQMLRIDHAIPELTVGEWRKSSVTVADLGRGYYVYRSAKK